MKSPEQIAEEIIAVWRNEHYPNRNEFIKTGDAELGRAIAAAIQAERELKDRAQRVRELIARCEKAERELAEAEKLLEPFADEYASYAEACYQQGEEPILAAKLVFGQGECRAARAFLQRRR